MLWWSSVNFVMQLGNPLIAMRMLQRATRLDNPQTPVFEGAVERQLAQLQREMEPDEWQGLRGELLRSDQPSEAVQSPHCAEQVANGGCAQRVY